MREKGVRMAESAGILCLVGLRACGHREHGPFHSLSFHMPCQQVPSLKWFLAAIDGALEGWVGIVVGFVPSKRSASVMISRPRQEDAHLRCSARVKICTGNQQECPTQIPKGGDSTFGHPGNSQAWTFLPFFALLIRCVVGV